MTTGNAVSTQPIPTQIVDQAREPRSEAHIPGEVGIWLFIYGDLTVFATLFGSYLYYRNQEISLFIESQRTLVQGFGVTNTLILLASSLFVVYGMRTMKQGLTRLAPRMFVCAIGCGVIFSGLKFLEWAAKVADGLTPTTNNFYMLYYALTGLHFLHLIVGMGILVFLMRTARLPTLTPLRFAAAEGGACFWHMVDLLWIVIFPLLYLVH